MRVILKYASLAIMMMVSLIVYFIGSIYILFNPYANIIFIGIVILNIICYARKKILVGDVLLGWWGQFCYGMPVVIFFSRLVERTHSVHWLEWVIVLLFSTWTASSFLLFVFSLSEWFKLKSSPKRSRYILRIITIVGILALMLYYVDRSVTTAVNDFYFPKKKLG